MKEFQISERQAGQRLDKYLGKVLDLAPKSFIYKMLRKKNIVLNEKKASGNEILKTEDIIRIYFKDETFAQFSSGEDRKYDQNCSVDDTPPDILYEDQDLLFLNKPAGVLSQKAKETDDSVNEWAIRYLLKSGAMKQEELQDFRPSIGNRLDRNTSGIISVGKTVHGLQVLGDWFHDHTVKKYYQCIVSGSITESGVLEGFLEKDKKNNQVKVGKQEKADSRKICLEYSPMEHYSGYTLLEVLLKTGRTHQIRAQLAAEGHPILGDPKYGDRDINQFWKKECGLSRQLLHACRLEFPDGRVIRAQLPADFSSVRKRLIGR